MSEKPDFKLHHHPENGWRGSYKICEYGLCGSKIVFTLDYIAVKYKSMPVTLADMLIDGAICKSYELDRILLIIGRDDNFVSIPGHLIAEYCTPFMGRIVVINGTTIFYENSEVTVIKY